MIEPVFKKYTDLIKDGTDLTRMMRDQGSEIGSWLGLSSTAVTFGLLSGSNFDAKVFCIDPWEIMPEQSNYSDELKGQDLFKIFSNNIERLKLLTYRYDSGKEEGPCSSDST